MPWAGCSVLLRISFPVYQESGRTQENYDAPAWLSKMRGSQHSVAAHHAARNAHASPESARAHTHGEQGKDVTKPKVLDYSRYIR